jgi:hypothetical protein
MRRKMAVDNRTYHTRALLLLLAAYEKKIAVPLSIYTDNT